MTHRDPPTIETGNAVADSTATRGWFVGDLAAWAAQRGERFDAGSTLRQSGAIQVKWSIHRPGEQRPGWAPTDEHLSISLLVDGAVRFDFRDAHGAERAVDLVQRGDYVLWHGPSHAHSWRTEPGCTLVTIRWPADLAPTDADHAREGRQR